MEDTLRHLMTGLMVFSAEAEAAGCGEHVKEQVLKDLAEFLLYTAGNRECAERTADLFLENGIPGSVPVPDDSFAGRIPGSLLTFIRADRMADGGPTGKDNSAAAVLIGTYRILAEKMIAGGGCAAGAGERLEACIRMYMQAL